MDINKLISLGREWTSTDGSKRRVYFNTDELVKFYGLRCRYYNSGNVSAATLDGETISNSDARAILSKFADCAIWYDLNTNTWGSRNFENKQRSYAKIVSAITAAAE